MSCSVWSKGGKRVSDIALAVFLVVLLWPVIIVVAMAIRVKLGSPVIFRQIRLGKDAQEFVLYKFRSMTDACDAYGNLLPDEHRLTRFGIWLRKSSIDELPQIINILKGDMSFIGPRPTLVAYKEDLLEKYPDRFTVLPGISSLPGVMGRNALDWETKFQLDCEYVRKFGFYTDMMIFIKTIPVVLGMKNITAPGSATASRYVDKDDNVP